MHTKDKLAEALRAVGLPVMAAKAAEGYYHDYLSPLAFPELTLANDLFTAAEMLPPSDRQRAILAVRKRVINGDFDANLEESSEWAETPEAAAMFDSLTRKGGAS